jgi:hypothetical protein
MYSAPVGVLPLLLAPLRVVALLRVAPLWAPEQLEGLWLPVEMPRPLTLQESGRTKPKAKGPSALDRQARSRAHLL